MAYYVCELRPDTQDVIVVRCLLDGKILKPFEGLIRSKMVQGLALH